MNVTKPKKARLAVRCILLAIPAEVILIFTCFLLGKGGDATKSALSPGGAILYLWHFPGFVLLDKIGLRFTGGWVYYFLVGFAEFFVVFWGIGHLLRAFYSKRLMRPTRAARSTGMNDEEFRKLL